MVVFSPDYAKSYKGVCKFIVLFSCGISLFLSAYTRPTLVQKRIVESTWKEDGLFYISITGISLTMLLLISNFIFCAAFKTNRKLKIMELTIYGLGCAGFIIFGAATLESALQIFMRVGDCCDEAFGKGPGKCNLPGFLKDSIDHYTGSSVFANPFSSSSTPSTGKPVIKLPNIPECKEETKLNAWLCTICINETIQPLFKIKGAAGAAGLIAALAHFIVVFVGIRELLPKKQSLESKF